MAIGSQHFLMHYVKPSLQAHGHSIAGRFCSSPQRRIVTWATTDENVTQFDVDVSATSAEVVEDLGPRDDDVGDRLPNVLARSLASNALANHLIATQDSINNEYSGTS